MKEKCPIYNPHLTLDEKTHTYKLKGFDGKLTSVTTLIGKFFEPFNSVKIASDLIQNNPKYHDYSLASLLSEWNKSGTHGTKVHNEIEKYVLDNSNSVSEPKADFAIDWLNETFKTEHLLFPEIRIISKKYKISDTIDLLAYNPKLDLYVIVDWKTNKKITTRSYQGKTGIKPPTYAVEDCKYNTYSLQLSLYRYILESEYNINIKRQVLVHLKPDGYTPYHTPYFKETIIQILKYHNGRKN